MDNTINNFSNTNVNTQFVQLLNTKQNKGNYLENVEGVITLTEDVVIAVGTFNGATATEMSHLEGVTGYIQDQLDQRATYTDLHDGLDTKQPQGNYLELTTQGRVQIHTGSVSTQYAGGGSGAPGSGGNSGGGSGGNNSGNPLSLDVSELGHLSGVTSNLQEQLDGKQPSGNYVTSTTLMTMNYLTPSSLTAMNYLTPSNLATYTGDLTGTQITLSGDVKAPSLRPPGGIQSMYGNTRIYSQIPSQVPLVVNSPTGQTIFQLDNNGGL